jgi:hypothetical protein
MERKDSNGVCDKDSQTCVVTVRAECVVIMCCVLYVV